MAAAELGDAPRGWRVTPAARRFCLRAGAG
jgi:hypothetical protein